MNKTLRNLGFAAAFALAAGFACTASEGLRGPGTLGSLPADLPLPPGFFLAEDEKSWLEGAGDTAAVHVALTGSNPPAEVYEFFRGHMLLARWKPLKTGPGPGMLEFRKGGRAARISVTKIEGGTRVVVDVETGTVEEKS